MTQTVASRPPGRPKSEGKRTAIIEAARLLFGANAYDSVTMDQVAQAAGVAKMTVYGHFHDKEAVFEAMVKSTSERMTGTLPAVPRSDGDLEDELVTFGQAFLSVLLSPEIVSACHRHFDMLSRNRVLAERFYNAGPGRTCATLAAYLATARIGGKLSPDMGDEAASDLMSLWLGELHMQLALGVIDSPTPEGIAQRVRRCTRLFLRAYAPLRRLEAVAE